MQEITEILDMVNNINNRAVRLRSLIDKLKTMSEESFNDVDAEYFSDYLEWAASELDAVYLMAAYLSRPVVETSRLWKNGRGQYETTKGYCFCEGSDIEVLVPNQSDPDYSHWERTRLKYDGKKYYLAEYPDLPLAGLPVRVRAGDKP